MESKKNNATSLQARIDELTKRGKDKEGSFKALEKTNNDLRKELEKERQKVLALQAKNG